MITADYKKYLLEFKQPAGTSRGILRTKETWFIVLRENSKIGIGECGLLRGLSVDDRADYESKLQWVCDNITLGEEQLYKSLTQFPSIQFGVEMAFGSLQADEPFEVFPSAFTEARAPIAINGLIWMGDKGFMKKQIAEKIATGFRCIKMKIGAIDFDTEYELLKSIRDEFSVSDIELRVDANGAFEYSEALDKLDRLSKLHLHSIEQPIQAGNWDDMGDLCDQTPLPIALDEELIGVFTDSYKRQLLDSIRPQYIILKPSFIGGIQGSDRWISMAEDRDIGWWVTSALESNVGLNTIAQYTFSKNTTLPQGLGTGGLYTNNFPAPLEIEKGTLLYNKTQKWDLSLLGVTF